MSHRSTKTVGTRSQIHIVFGVLATLMLVACAVEDTRPRDDSITNNARSSRQWTQRVTLAVPVGTDIDAAAALFRKSGFRCETQFRNGKDSCYKTTGNDWMGAWSRWRVDFSVTGGRIVSFRAFYDHNDA
jgi:hypothetical protein